MPESYVPPKKLPIVNGLPTHYIAQITSSPKRGTIEPSSTNTQGVITMEKSETRPTQAEAAQQEEQRQLGHLALYEAPRGVADTQSWDQAVQPYFGE